MAERHLPQRMDPDLALFTVTVAARLADMHPQTLRGYDRLGLVVPSRARGRGRRYTLRDVARLRHIQQLSSEGISLEGIRRILELEAQLDALSDHVDYLTDLLRQHQEAAQTEARLFTAAASGDVHLGRLRVQAPLELPGRRTAG